MARKVKETGPKLFGYLLLNQPGARVESVHGAYFKPEYAESALVEALKRNLHLTGRIVELKKIADVRLQFTAVKE
jgi:hypothetical protein